MPILLYVVAGDGSKGKNQPSLLKASVKNSKRLNSIPMSGIRRMFDLVTPETVNLGLGEPDMAPPSVAVETMAEAARRGLNKYGPSAGIPELRKAIAELNHGYNPHLQMGNVLVTPSGTSGLLAVTQALLDPGDEALVPDPGFVLYEPHTLLAEAKPRFYRLTEGDFQPDMDSIQEQVTSRTKIIFVNNPSNPTGGTLDRESYKALCDLADDRGIIIVSDEVYDRLVYEGDHLSFMDHLDKALVVNGFSKTLAAPGWRLGYVVADEGLMADLTKMSYHICASPNTPVQHGVLAALPSIDGYLEGIRKVFHGRRRLITDLINEIPGFSLEDPKGAFYAFPSYEQEIKSEDLAMKLVKAGMVCTPGTVFGRSGENHLRFSYATSEDMIKKGMAILDKVVREL